MGETIKVFLVGREKELPWATLVGDLYSVLGISRWSTLLLVNGKPQADDRYLEEGDSITWIKITYHESPVTRNEDL